MLVLYGEVSMLWKQLNENGLTLVESMVGLAIAMVLFGSLITAALAVRSLVAFNRHYIQALNVARGALETVKGQGYGAAVDDTWQQAFDAGADAQFGTADDLMGTVTITVRDHVDLDGDGDTAETLVDLDGDGANDAARPIRSTFSWNERVAGQTRSLSVWIDALIAA